MVPRARALGVMRRCASSRAPDLGLLSLFSVVHPANHSSRRLAQRLGATLIGETTLRGQPRLPCRHRDLKSETSTQSKSNDIRRKHVCPS
jgi:RimJ/RimL family protein N-acetyltransferase